MGVVIREPRARILAFAVVLASASLAYAEDARSEPRAAAEIHAIVPSGAQIVVMPFWAHFQYPFFPDHDLVKEDAAPADAAWFLWTGHDLDSRPKDGWTLVRSWEARQEFGPGTRLSLALEKALTGSVPDAWPWPTLELYARASPASGA